MLGIDTLGSVSERSNQLCCNININTLVYLNDKNKACLSDTLNNFYVSRGLLLPYPGYSGSNKRLIFHERCWENLTKHFNDEELNLGGIFQAFVIAPKRYMFNSISGLLLIFSFWLGSIGTNDPDSGPTYHLAK